MSPGDLTERAFEERIEAELAKSGWRTGIGSAFGLYDAELGIHTGTLWEFVSKTQVDNWNRLVELYGGDPDITQKQFARRVASEIDSRGTLDVLREGVKDRGVLIELCYFKPGHTLAEDALQGYNANILLAARQFHFSARDRNDSVDFALIVNGLPVATIELKNQSTGQNAAEDATEQYRKRNPDDLFFAKRTLVHFAVDPDWALITTRLRGKDTEFLPFNLGSNGPGVSGGAGNPKSVRDDGYAVDYLWAHTWQRDNWLEILQRFMHVETTDKKRAKLNPHTSKRIFPRFHQWHAVQQMVTHAYEHGAGNNYLIEHSTGSGKSNTIAWLAHRLSNLFDKDNQPVFHKVVVITDRNVLDRQLQQTIFQFDHTPGVVKRIDEDSGQLADALGDSTSKIVISTLQKYPYVLDKITGTDLGSKRYAVIIDEAHSSQGGDAATRLKEAIGANAQSGDDDEDEVTRQARIRGPQPNLSYFAFTATPKNPTLKLFGRWDPDVPNPRKPRERGMHVPFHVYSMRQAIEEGYILDVLANYITYESKWRLREAARERFIDDPEVDERKAKARLVKLAVMHPTSIAQRARLIVEDFRDNLAGRLGGRAKAMVVCSGRQHALEMFQEIRKWNDDLPGCGFGTLVAFSGSLKNGDQVEFTEAQLNGFGESQLPDRFGYVKADDPNAKTKNQEEYRILVVADKYQTGFDQPLLCGMYVDKQLAGVSAVQTLSRLNRIHPMKTQDDVRILDFANPAQRIQDSFLPWFETTIAEPEDPNILYDRQRKVMEYGLLVESEMESFIRVLSEAGPGRLPSAAERALHARLHHYLAPAIDRFAELDSHDQEEFRKALQSFTRMYSLVAQLIDWGDPDLERLYQYGRVLLIRLPGRPQESVDIGDADLSHYRLEKAAEDNLSLSPSDPGDGVVRGYSDGGGGYREPEIRPLSEIIGELNDRFGLGLSTSDEILVYQQVLGLVEDPKAQQVGLMNDETRFGQVADDKLDDIVAENAERNTEFIKLYFDNPEFQKAVKEAARKRAYKIITDPARDEALARLRAEMGKETGVLTRGDT
jgi:type I restriction enzyme, R subunit